MFWAKNYVSSHQFDALLNKEDVTLQEVMDHEDTLEQYKSQNKKLVEYLIRYDVMKELVTLVTTEPPIDVEERWRYRYSNIACELLMCDVPPFNEKLAGEETLLGMLYSFMDTEEPLNPLLASFVSKIIGLLIARKADQNWYSYQFTCLQILEFLKSRQTCVDLLLRHLETSAIMDLILKLVTEVEGNDMRQNVLNWLDSQQLVQRLVKLLSPNSESSKHANAGQLLSDIVIVARDIQRTSTERTGPDIILNTLESPATVSLLLETILTGEKLESSIVGGIRVLLTLLGQKDNNSSVEDDIQVNDYGDKATVSSELRLRRISNATLPYLEQLHKLLLDPPYKPPVKTTTGVLECPLGNTRLYVAKLFTALLTTENIKIYETLVELGTFQTLLDLFFKYTWNNFLHTQVQLCLTLAINCDFKDTNDIIYVNIFNKCRLINSILYAWDKNESKENKENGVRQGYMGHLINIANNIVSQCEKSESLDEFLKANLSSECLTKWDNLVKTELAKINMTYKLQLVEAYTTNSGDNPEGYGAFPRDHFLDVQQIKQVYSNFVGQIMTQEFHDFGQQNEDIYDGSNALHTSADQLSTMGFTLSDEILDKREDMFNKICQQKQKAGLEDCSAGVEWGDEGELTFQTVVDKRDWPTKQQQQQNDSNSSDEDEDDDDDDDDDDSGDMHMKIKLIERCRSRGRRESTVRSPPEVNPWKVIPFTPIEATGWANFDNFENTLSIENPVIVDKKLCDEEKEETADSTTDSKKTETTLESKVDTIGSGETKVADSDTTSSSTETNVNHKSTEDSLFPVCIADKNANPSEILDSRETKCEEILQNTELSENEQSSNNDNKISCSLKNASLEAVPPASDTK